MLLQRMEKKGKGLKYANEGQPTVIAKGFGKCDHCPNYAFSSKMKKEYKRNLHLHIPSTMQVLQMSLASTGISLTVATINYH